MSDDNAWVERLHTVVDELAAKVAAPHEDRLRCRAGCSACCQDGITVFDIEADLIRARHGELLERAAAHAPGGCAFLDEAGRCRIYASRPYVCRTQGLPLRWLEEEDGEVVEARSVCPLNEPGGPPLEELALDTLWTIGPFEARLAERQRARDGGEGRRVSLRDLFHDPGSGRRRLPIAR